MRLLQILNENHHGYARRHSTNHVKDPIVYSFSNGLLNDIRRGNIIETELHMADKVFRDMQAIDWVICDKFGTVEYDLYN